MMTVNEDFINHVFDAMAIIRPKLASLKDPDEIDFDIRELSNSITKSYPWPIGIEIRRLLSGNMEKLDRGRMDQILKTIERTMQFMTFIMLIQLFDESFNREVQISEGFKKEFSRRFSVLTLGNYAYLIRTMGKIFRENKIAPFCEELENLLDNKFYNKLDFWVPERNEIGHYQINLTEEEVEVRCSEYLARLKDILIDLAFLIKYPLLTVTEIQLIKPKHAVGQFSHNMLMLNSASSSFLGRSEDFLKFTDSQSVILVKNLKDAPEIFLNLFPLIIDTHPEKMESREKLTKVKKDVYMYTRWDEKEKRLYYVGTETTEKVDLRLVSYYDYLIDQFEGIMNTFSIKE
jgi:hypothetical protein